MLFRVENIGLDLIQGVLFELTNVFKFSIDFLFMVSFELIVIFVLSVFVDDCIFEVRLCFMIDDVDTNN